MARPIEDDDYYQRLREADADTLNIIPDVRVWIEGEAYVYRDEPEKRVVKDNLHQFCDALGLQYYQQDVTDNLDRPRRRTYKHNRIGRQGVLAHIAEHPGCTLNEMILKFYGPKDPGASNRLRAILRSMRFDVIVRSDRGGCNHYFPTKITRDAVHEARCHAMENLLHKRFGQHPTISWSDVVQFIADELARAEPVKTFIAPEEIQGTMPAYIAERTGCTFQQAVNYLTHGVHGAKAVADYSRRMIARETPIATQGLSPPSPPAPTPA